MSASRPAADEFGFIRARQTEIRTDEQPRCPTSPTKLLYICLRESVRCPGTCAFRGDWIGPQPA